MSGKHKDYTPRPHKVRKCIQCGIDITEKTANVVRCDECQLLHRRRRKVNPYSHEAIKQRKITGLGTSDFGPHMRLKKDKKTPNFKAEQKAIDNEWRKITWRRRKHNPEYKEDERGDYDISQYNSGEDCEEDKDQYEA